MKKATKKQEEQIKVVMDIWEKSGALDVGLLLVIFHAILTNKTKDFFERVCAGQTIQQIGDAYMK